MDGVEGSWRVVYELNEAMRGGDLVAHCCLYRTKLKGSGVKSATVGKERVQLTMNEVRVKEGSAPQPPRARERGPRGAAGACPGRKTAHAPWPRTPPSTTPSNPGNSSAPVTTVPPPSSGTPRPPPVRPSRSTAHRSILCFFPIRHSGGTLGRPGASQPCPTLPFGCLGSASRGSYHQQSRAREGTRGGGAVRRQGATSGGAYYLGRG